MNRPDQPTSLQPLPEPGEDPIAGLLAEVLSSEAARIQPADRLADIRTEGARRRRPWERVLPVAAGAAAVVLIGGGVWTVVDRTGDQGSRRPVAASSPSPAATPTTNTTPRSTPSPTSSPSSTVGTWAAPIYYLGRSVTGLFREFHRLPVTPGPVVSHITDAFRVAMDPNSPTRSEADFSPWLAGTSAAVQVGMSGPSTVVVTLPDTEKTGRGATREQARLAAQQLVWTATAVAQDAQLGVRIRFVHGTGKLFGVLPVDQTFHRPPANLTYQDLSSIWILTPGQGATVGPSVVLAGQACTFEANVAWQLLRGSAVVGSGHTQTPQACPARGNWSVPLTGLAPGTYTFRAFELSPQGGSAYQGLDTVTFTVR